ncbi:MAG TPA: TlpA family protein disulfide reductase [Caldilineae bacterium]|nr:TlpA family protein disulfide reductase [Caldilineae bacterium]
MPSKNLFLLLTLLILAPILTACGQTNAAPQPTQAVAVTQAPTLVINTPTPLPPTPTPDPNASPTPENLAPDFTAVNLQTGKPIALSDYRGRIVLLNFWGSWCPPCRMEMPAFQEVYEAYDGKVVIIGVGVNDSEANLLGFVKEKGITYPIIWDRTSEVARKYRIRSLPTTYKIDQQGLMTGVAMGALTKEQLVAAIETMLGEERK